ncbi:hypothetical protein DEU56DRAFT_922536 [Suillus clintonianus]|uniref:uncharacterized protein n=1 Tax=Suillus clintonianus TaxID=1904413 RepID=UPI001B87CB26|nr:uncharacterized protein DEU56DRAFT_922536 [Suillus clintonianus]KAG2150360.1 hypothetical protein DEU56DRAFT_922536 [Suillus clintonianus]
MGHMANASPSNDESPGAYIVTFGKYAGHRLDSIPSNLRLWATGVKCRDTRWYAAFKRANEQYETLLLQSPEAYPLPFGEYEDTQLSQVPEYYMRNIHAISLVPQYRNLVEANRRYRNNAWQSTPSGSAVASLAAPAIGNHSCPQWEDLVGRHDVLPATPPRPYRKRRPANVQNPVGELVDQRDDVRGSAGPDDKYELDDFVVPDDDDEGASDFESDYGADPTSDDNDDDLQGSGSHTERLLPSRSSTDDSQTLESESKSDSDNDTPLGQLRDKIMAKRVAGKRKAEVISSPSPQREQQSSGEGSDDDIVTQPPRKRLKGAD